MPDSDLSTDLEEARQSEAPAAFAPTMWFPDEVKAFVQDRYRKAACILEYGSGGSTVFAARETTARILSIESDRKWAADLVTYLAAEGIDRAGVEVRVANVGPTGAWGRPNETRHWTKFVDYPLLPWQDPDFTPDLVLIDGRFRLACLAATMLHCKRPTTVLVDDYGRRRYRQVETLLPVAEHVGHMARFEVTPKAWSNEDFLRMIPWFFTIK